VILAGDIGGTKSNLALFVLQEGKLRKLRQQRFPSRDYDGLEAVVHEFLSAAPVPVTAAAFGIAGPVSNNRVQATNLPWTVDGEALRDALRAPVVLLNDLEAAGWGLPQLERDQFLVLQAGTPLETANRAILAPGTGLGEAILFWDGRRHVPSATEGGHADFAPRNDTEIELLRFLKRRFVSVSFETVVSGSGFLLIHEFFDPELRHPEFDRPEEDPAPAITRRSREGSCAVCRKTVDLWVSLCGAEAGNLALKALARGGVYIAGGIVPKILDEVKAGGFVRAFQEKSKFQSLLQQIPIYVVLDEDLPLVGAAVRAAQELKVKS
jgi:glucokinase